jgi:hypothetical protein
MASLAWWPKGPTAGPSRAGLAAHAENRGGRLSWHRAAAPVAKRGQPGRRASAGDDERGGGVDGRVAHRRGKLWEHDPGARPVRRVHEWRTQPQRRTPVRRAAMAREEVGPQSPGDDDDCRQGATLGQAAER